MKCCLNVTKGNHFCNKLWRVTIVTKNVFVLKADIIVALAWLVHQHQGYIVSAWPCSIWRKRGIVYYGLLKPGETFNTQRYRQQLINLGQTLIERRLEWARRQGNVILVHDSAPFHTAKLVEDTLKLIGWDILLNLPYSLDLVHPYYRTYTWHLFKYFNEYHLQSEHLLKGIMRSTLKSISKTF